MDNKYRFIRNFVALGVGACWMLTAKTESVPVPSNGLVHLEGRTPVLDLIGDGQGFGRARHRDGVKFWTLEPAEATSLRLTGSGLDISFVSFSIYGSSGTVISVGGAVFGIVDSGANGFADVRVLSGSETWRTLGLHVPYLQYEGKSLASLPVLTVRLKPAAGVFDVYAGSRMIAEDMPLAADPDEWFTVTTGPSGAWVSGLVQSEDNPFYEDTNRNGVDDSFELKKNGQLLSRNLSVEERHRLIAEWRNDQRMNRPPALFTNRPRPDA